MHELRRGLQPFLDARKPPERALVAVVGLTSAGEGTGEVLPGVRAESSGLFMGSTP